MLLEAAAAAAAAAAVEEADPKGCSDKEEDLTERVKVREHQAALLCLQERLASAIRALVWQMHSIVRAIDLEQRGKRGICRSLLPLYNRSLLNKRKMLARSRSQALVQSNGI